MTNTRQCKSCGTIGCYIGAEVCESCLRSSTTTTDRAGADIAKVYAQAHKVASPAVSLSADGGHGAHCYDADGLLICGWPNELDSMGADAMAKGFGWAGSVKVYAHPITANGKARVSYPQPEGSNCFTVSCACGIFHFCDSHDQANQIAYVHNTMEKVVR